MVYYRHTVIHFGLFSFPQARESILKTMHLAKVIQGLNGTDDVRCLGPLPGAICFFLRLQPKI